MRANRLLCVQLRACRRSAYYSGSAMEGIRTFRLEISDSRPFRLVYGGYHRCKACVSPRYQRYLSPKPTTLAENDRLTLCVQICWGPLSYVVAAFIIQDHDLRYPLQLIVSLGQLYGAVLYYATNSFNHYFYHVSYSRPEAFYFWGYYVAINALWIVIPMSELTSRRTG